MARIKKGPHHAALCFSFQVRLFRRQGIETRLNNTVLIHSKCAIQLGVTRDNTGPNYSRNNCEVQDTV